VWELKLGVLVREVVTNYVPKTSDRSFVNRLASPETKAESAYDFPPRAKRTYALSPFVFLSWGRVVMNDEGRDLLLRAAGRVAERVDA